MTETIGVIIHAAGIVLVLPAFIYLAARILWRRTPRRPTVILFRREHEPTKRQHQTIH